MEAYIFNIHDVVLFMTIIECILLALFQWALPHGKRLSSAMLIAFLLANGMHSGCILLLWNDLVHTTAFFDLHVVPYLITLAIMIKGPALLLYVASLTQQHFTLQRRHLLHLLPVVISWLVIVGFGIDSDTLRWRGPTLTPLTDTVVNYIWHATKVVPFVYGTGAFYLVQRYRRNLKDQYSAISTEEPRWLSVLTFSFLLSWIFSIFVHIGSQFLPVSTANIMGISENYLVFLLINGLFAYSIAYAHRVLTTTPITEKETPIEKLDNNAIGKVKAGMEEKKLYLEQNLNIEEFSSRIDLPVRDVSSVINKHFGTNFFEFMNSYRVDEAKRLLADQTLTDLTILDILLQAGFNSKSAFHRFFKRLVGLSPSEFRKQAKP